MKPLRWKRCLPRNKHSSVRNKHDSKSSREPCRKIWRLWLLLLVALSLGLGGERADTDILPYDIQNQHIQVKKKSLLLIWGNIQNQHIQVKKRHLHLILANTKVHLHLDMKVNKTIFITSLLQSQMLLGVGVGNKRILQKAVRRSGTRWPSLVRKARSWCIYLLEPRSFPPISPRLCSMAGRPKGWLTVGRCLLI